MAPDGTGAIPEGSPFRVPWWRSLLGGGRIAPVVLDRRVGERRQRRHRVAWERRQGERRILADPDHSADVTYLGPGSRWEGELRFQGILRIDGELEGPSIRGESLIIGEGARVQAALEVDRLLVFGQLRGVVHARRRVELRAPSRVTGTIWAPRVEIWPGGLFQGTCHLGEDTQALAA